MLLERESGRAELREITEMAALGSCVFWLESFGWDEWRIMGYDLEQEEVWQTASGCGGEPRLAAYLVQHFGWPEELMAAP